MKRLWMAPPEIPESPFIAVYRCQFELPCQTTLNFSFSADERAQLFLDGKRIADGPERGAPERWYMQNSSISGKAGKHILTARVTGLGFHNWAYAQLSVKHGLWIDDPSGTLQNWECQIENGCSFEPGFPDWGAFPRIHLDRSHNPDILNGKGGQWLPVAVFEDERPLFPPDLPEMRYEAVVPQDRGNGIYYFPQYVCAWGEYHFSGQGTVNIRWSETPYQTPEFDRSTLTGNKGKRDGKFFIGNFDTFEINGELHWFDYWWHAGHYCQVITEGNVKYQMKFHRTGYPYEKFESADPLTKMAVETLQACSFETYMDCPYYEQLMYIGDSRLEAICTRLITKDDRLIRKSLRILGLSQRPDGSLNAQYPSRSIQTIPSFMLIWILMLHDHWLINGCDELTEELLPKARKLMKYLTTCEKNDLLAIDGWNFIDWCPEPWERGTPPGGKINSILNLFYVMALQAMAEIADDDSYRKKADKLFCRIKKIFFVKEKNLYSIDPEHRFFSEHPQVLSLILEDDPLLAEALRNGIGELTPCSIYFSFYFLQACQKRNLNAMGKARLNKWKKFAAEGLTTFPEEFDNPRSDCHAWSSHILCFLLNGEKQQ